jgi:DNA processing protein
MSAPTETAAIVAALRHRRGNRSIIDNGADAYELLQREHGLLAEQLLVEAALELEQWRGQGIRVLSPADAEYPQNLLSLGDRPPLIFLSGQLRPADSRSVAIIGSRRASASGLALSDALACGLVEAGYTVVSGLARGIDTAAHTAALSVGGRTIAVIGTGLRHCYPRENRALQHRIARENAVVSRFWPEAPPTRRSFPLRNALMAGISLATVIVEAGPTSGARAQARFGLAHGRPVILLDAVLEQEWARELTQRPGVHVVGAAGEVPPLIDRLTEESLAA